jgi:protoporphyrinogen oxidase
MEKRKKSQRALNYQIKNEATNIDTFEKKEKNILIIGAGPAGLSAAHRLLSNNQNKKNEKDTKYNILILEADAQVGGISKTVEHNGYRMDLGGHRFFSKNQEVNDFWNEIMPLQGEPSYDDIINGRKLELNPNGPNPQLENNVFLKRQRVSRIFYKRKFFDYPVSLKYSTLKNMGFLSTIKVGCGYLKSCVSKKDESNLENFYINRFGKPLYSMFFEDYTEKLWGRHPNNISADWGAQRVKGLSIKALLKNMMPKSKKKKQEQETSLIEEFIYPKYGPGQFWEKVASEIEEMGGTIKYNCEVIKIIQENGKISTIVFKDENGNEKDVHADYFMSSMPLKDLVVNMNDVPQNINYIASKLPYRDFVTVGVLVDQLKLKNNNKKIHTINHLIPDCWLYIQEPDVKMGRVQVFNNWSPYLLHDISNVWISTEYFCNEGDDFWNMTDEEASDFVIKELIKTGIISDEKDVKDTHRVKVKKAYPAYFDTYSNIDEVINYLNTINNLYCIGRNGQHRYNNMDHSMLTGFYAADDIINNLNNKDKIWNVNAEKEYHESK